MTINYAQQAGMSEYDWMELLGFTRKVENEGYDYASENYAPKFESDGLKAVADNETSLRVLYRKHLPLVEAWQKATGWEEVGRLWDAHLREEKERSEAHLLWAVHPGGDWNYHAYTDAFETREAVDKWIEGRHELVAKHGWKPWAGHILHRDTPGGEWTRVAA